MRPCGCTAVRPAVWPPLPSSQVFHTHQDGFAACTLPVDLAEELRSSIDVDRLGRLAATAGFGPLVLSQCFVAPRDALSPCHVCVQPRTPGRVGYLLCCVCVCTGLPQ